MTRSAHRPLTGKVVLITGAARGIGAAAAVELARRGAVPVLADVDAAALDRTAAALPGDPLTVTLDVTDLRACQDAVAEALDRHGRLDAVWANAGIASFGPLELTDPQLWTRTVEVNLLGAFHTVRAALPAVIGARGYVAVTASTATFMHPPGLSAYAATKAGVEAMANALRMEVAHQGVDVGTLHPTWIGTDMVREGEEMAGFARLRAAMRPPFRRTHPIESIVPAIADAFERRQRRVCLPGFVRLAHALRPVLTTALAERDLRAAAPDMRRLFLDEDRARGVRAGVSGRWAEDLRP